MVAIIIIAGLLVGLIAGLLIGFVYGRKMEKSRNNEMLNFYEEAIGNMKSEFDKTVASLNSGMQAATEEMLGRRQNEFAKRSTEQLDSLLQPLQQTIREMKDTVATNTARNAELGGKLDANLNSLFVQTAAARESADKLTNALRGNNRVQGFWGEVILKEMLESQGLKEGLHFDIQQTLRNNDGRIMKSDLADSMRPDVVLHLDKTRDIIIDSKVSLSAYLEYINSEDDDNRKLALAKHIRSLENHVAELSKKDYSGHLLQGKESMGFVIMFVPNSPALMLAIGSRPDLWRNALEKKVYIADEQTLYAALKIIGMTWQQIKQASNHEKVYALAQEMLDRVGKFMECYMNIGESINDARESYEKGLKKLQEGGQSIPGTCRKLINMGAKVSKRPKGVPPQLLGEEGEELG